MTEYKEINFILTESQMKKLANAHANKIEVRLKLNNRQISPNNGIPLLLTNSEIKKLSDNKDHFITISASRVSRGGFLPALLAALPAIIGGVSGITGIASNIKSMVDKKKKDKGSGLFLNPNPGAGGLFLTP